MKYTKINKTFEHIKQYGMMSYYILTDKRTPIYFKIIPLIVCIVYLIVPIDISPDFIPFFGWIDDAFLFPILFSFVLNKVPEPIKEESQEKARQKLDRWEKNTKLSIMIATISLLTLITIGVVIWLFYYYPI